MASGTTLGSKLAVQSPSHVSWIIILTVPVVTDSIHVIKEMLYTLTALPQLGWEQKIPAP